MRRRYTPEMVEEVKKHLTITDIWVLMGLPGRPAKSCKSPFRDDHNPSFSVFDNGQRWKDHATGEGGDVIEFLAKALKMSPREAFKEYIHLARRKGLV